MADKQATGAATNLTAQLSGIICNVRFESLDGTTIATAKRLIMDGIAVAIAGSREPASQLYAAHAAEIECARQASVWGHSRQTSPLFAAFGNAVSMHVLDFEPMSNPPTHAVSPTVPVAFAIAEAKGLNGAEIVAACAKGFEMQGRILVASKLERGALPFHTPGVVGLMGSAVVASHLLQLDSSQLVNALGIAASRCSGLPANTGSMVKCTHCGNAAAAGLEAALLAKRAFTASPDILGAPRGYIETFFGQRFDAAKLLEFGKPYRFVDPGMAIKFFPSKYPTHFAISVALDLRKMIGRPEDVSRVRIVAPVIEDADRPRPRSGLEGKFSLQYTFAAGLLDGNVGIKSFTDERRFASDMTALLEKIELTPDPSRSRDTRNMRVDAEIVMNDGSVQRAACEGPPGTWGKPLDIERHDAKLDDCFAVGLSSHDVADVRASLSRLETLSGSEVRHLNHLLAGNKLQ